MAYTMLIMPDLPKTTDTKAAHSENTQVREVNQFGHTWDEHERYLRARLKAHVSPEDLEREISIQRDAFKDFAKLVAAPDGRETQLNNSLKATPPALRWRVLEAARKSWS